MNLYCPSCKSDKIVCLGEIPVGGVLCQFLSGGNLYCCAMAEHISFINEPWCCKTAQELNLIIKNMKKFSHKEGNFTRKILDLGLNTIYRFAPNIIGMLRASGFGGIDVRKDKRLRRFPPSWLSAKDHLIVLFRKENR